MAMTEIKNRMVRTSRYIDIHTHVLPGVDDGARTMEEACELVRRSAEAGCRAIIATPHYSRRRGAEGYAEITEQFREAIRQNATEQNTETVEIYLGHETYYHEELVEYLKQGKALTMAGSRYVLVEFDTGGSLQTMSRAIRRMLAEGYVPILAHMERYECLREKRNLDSICSSGCLMQMNYESLQGHWFSPEIRWCRKQILEGRIHFLGTDMHRTDYRPPEVGKAMTWLAKHADERLFKDLTYRNAERVIRDERI